LKTAAVVVSYKNEDQTKKCLDCLNKEGIFVHHLDNSVNNRGFTKAYNEGILELKNKFEYILIINSDCYIHDGFLKNIESFMDDNQKCGISGVKQISSDGKYITHAGCLQAYPYGVHISGKVDESGLNVDKMVPWVNGACIVARSKMIDDIGLMDENMFLIGSDSDWCYTARSRGWEVWYVSNAVCTHDGGVSANTENEEMNDLKYLDMVYWKNKWIDGGLFKKLSSF
jgi:GT2 family glycosyltransferase